MRLLDKELICRFQEVGEQIGVKNPLILAKFYTTWNDWVWYTAEYYPKVDAFYGYVLKDGIGKRCYFKLPEESIDGLQVVRDVGFKEGRLEFSV